MPEAGYTDEQLVTMLKNSDEAAFAALYDRYWDRLLVRAYTAVQSHEDAEEIVQDAFADLWKSRATIKLNYTFHTYIAAVVKYKCYRHIVSRKPAALQPENAPEHEDRSTEEWLDFISLRDSLEAAVTQLPDKCQLIFRLSREQGLTDNEIARRLEIAPKTVRTQMYRALKKLRAAARHQLLGSVFPPFL
jgi:RNA polymerase sigma-70 factor (family 1)